MSAPFQPRRALPPDEPEKVAPVDRIRQFVRYALSLEGREKGEGQVFCDRLFVAFGHEGYREAGATLEERVRVRGQRPKFADLRWRDILLLEMKSRGERLERHYDQAFEYWLELVPKRKKFLYYEISMNFEFMI